MRKLIYLLAFVFAIGTVLWFALTDRPAPSEPAAVPDIETATSASNDSLEPAATEYTITESAAEEVASIRGFVQSLETGEGIEGATVRVTWQEDEESRDAEKVTDAEGGFALFARDAGDYSIEVSHAVLASEESRYTVTVGEDEPAPQIVIWMTPGGVISGRVYDSVTNDGIAGVRIGLNRKQSPGVMTGADGQYRLEGVRAGSRRIFVGHAKGYIDRPRNSDGVRVTVSREKELADVDFPLQPGVFAAIEGKVVDERGNAVALADVDALSRNNAMNDYQQRSAKTKPDGTFRLTELRVAGGFYVTAKLEGHVSEDLGPLGLTADGIRDIVLTLRPTGSISGQVVDENSGSPVAEQEFTVDTMYTLRGRNTIGGRSDNLDENGHFELVDLPPGSYGLFVDSNPDFHSTGIQQAQVTVDVEPGQHLTDIRLTYDYERYLQSKVTRKTRSRKPERRGRLSIPRVGEVRGRVVRARTDDAVTTFELKISHSRRTSSRTVHDPDGRFTIAEGQGETLTITIASKGFVPTEEVVQGGLGEQPVHDVTVHLQPGAMVEGRVVDSSRNAVAGAEIYISVDPSLSNGSPLGTPSDAVSGQDGSFQLDTLAAATTRIYASHPAFAVGSAEVSASTSRATRLEIVLDKGGAFAGFVRRAGVPLAGQNIFVRNGANDYVQLADSHTDGQGFFRFDHLTPGVYTLYTLIDDLSRSLYIDAAVVEGKVTEVNFDFDDTENAVQGAVLLNGQQPSSVSAWAEIQRETGIERIRKRPFESGEYMLTNLPVGEAAVTVQASQPDGSSASESLTLSITGGVVRRDLELHSEQ